VAAAATASVMKANGVSTLAGLRLIADPTKLAWKNSIMTYNFGA
jgi:hypothetical protein